LRTALLGFGARIYLLVAILIIGIMAAAASYFLVTQNRALKEALTEQARSLSESLAEGMRLGVLLEDREYVRQVASGILGLPNILYIDVYLGSGDLLQQLGEMKHQLLVPDAAFREASLSGFNIGDEVDGGKEKGYRDFMVPVRFDEGSREVAGFVRIGLSTASISRKWQETLVTTAWATLALVLLACLLIYPPMRRMIRPIEALSLGALRIGQGDLDFKLAVQRDDEIGQLAVNFNEMAMSLRKQNAEIQDKTVKLEASEGKFRQLFENIGQPLYINTLDGRLLDCNQAMVDLFGYASRDEMIETVQDGRQLFADASKRSEVLAELLANGEIKEKAVEFKRRDGTILKTLVTSRVRTDDTGEIIGSEGLIQDVTQMRSLEEQLFHAQKMESIGTLAGGIAHDFNNLLAAILSSAEMARMKIDDRPSVERYINTITKASNRAAELTKGLLGFARKGKTRVEEVNVGVLVSELESLLRETIDRSVGIYTDIPASLWPVRGNPSQIHQVLLNLCVNARDAILEAGGRELSISLRNTVIDQDFVDAHATAICGAYVQIDVHDDGCGIPEHIREQIFEPFFTTKEVGKGTGLGLATVYGIIKSHNGFLCLNSKEGKGTTFHIYLPAAIDDGVILPEAATLRHMPNVAPVGSGQEGAVTILFVDDEEILRLVAFEFLQEMGYHVLIAENGKQALELIAGQIGMIDLVVVDLMMPVMGGEEVLKVVKRDHPGIPVIIASGYSANSLQKNLATQNYDGFLEKPYDLSHFGRVIEGLLSSR